MTHRTWIVGKKIVKKEKMEPKKHKFVPTNIDVEELLKGGIFKDGGVVPFDPEKDRQPALTPEEISQGVRLAPKFDMVNRPPHYNMGKIEVSDFIADQKLDFFEGNVVKYLCRHKYKNGIEDLRKAEWYLTKLIKNLTTSKSEEGK